MYQPEVSKKAKNALSEITNKYPEPIIRLINNALREGEVKMSDITNLQNQYQSEPTIVTVAINDFFNKSK